MFVKKSPLLEDSSNGGPGPRGKVRNTRKGGARNDWSGESCSLTDWQPGYLFIYTEYSKQE